jgi:hypothetical protein
LSKSGKLQKKVPMEAKKISLDLHDNTKLTRFFQIVFGTFCLAVSVWFLFKLFETHTLAGANAIAVVFLFLIGVWELAAGFGFTGRYIIVSEENLTIKHSHFLRPLIIKPSDLKIVIFKPVSFELFYHNGEKTIIRLGIYYRERSVEILESIEEFCKINQVPVEGSDSDEK